MTSERDDGRTRLSAREIAYARFAVDRLRDSSQDDWPLLAKILDSLLAEHATLRAKLSEVERTRAQVQADLNERTKQVGAWMDECERAAVTIVVAERERDAATARAEQAEKREQIATDLAKTGNDIMLAATARAAEAERLLRDIVEADDKWPGDSCADGWDANLDAVIDRIDSARSHLQSLKAKEPTDGE